MKVLAILAIIVALAACTITFWPRTCKCHTCDDKSCTFCHCKEKGACGDRHCR